MRLRKMLLWYLLFLIVPLTAILCLLGKDFVLDEAAKIKPYAVVFRDAQKTSEARRTSDRLVIFFGDSSVAQPPWADKKTPHIPALLQAELARERPDLGKVSVVEWAFDGARIFHYYCLLFQAMKYRPDLIVIPVNWRNLGPSGWEEDKKYAFREMSALAPLFERGQAAGRRMMTQEGVTPLAQVFYRARLPLLYAQGLRAWGNERLGLSKEKNLDNLMEIMPSVDKLMAGFTDEKLLREYYPISVGGDNQRLDALEALSQTARRRGLSALFYLTPIHVEEMRRRSGYSETAFQESITHVEKIALSEGGDCVNLIDLLEEKDFLDCFEHYTPEGNARVAQELAPEAARLMTIRAQATAPIARGPAR